MKKVVKNFNMHESRVVVVPLAQHFKLSIDHRPRTTEEQAEMEQVPYANIVGIASCIS